VTVNTGNLSRDRSFLKWIAIASGFTFLVQLWLFRSIIRDYFPTADELALEVASTPIFGHFEPASWFTHGFHFYFQSFAEWQSANTDFWRPLANVLFWLNYEIFGTHWSNQLVVGYLSHALTVGLTGYVSRCAFKLSRQLTITAMIVSALSPAFWSPNDTYNSFSYNTAPELIQYPVYQTEILCALLMICAFLAFIKRRYVLFCVVTTLALLLKETALTAPVAALAIIGGWWQSDDRGRAARNFIWLMLPLVLWSLARVAIFDYGKSIYVLSTSTAWGWLLKPIRNLLYLPTLLYRGPLRETKDAILGHRTGLVLLHGFELAVNAAWWLAVLYAVRRAYVDIRKDGLFALPRPSVCGLIFALGNLCLVMLLQAPDARFTYFWFALGPTAVFAALSDRRHGVLAAMVIAAALVLPQFWWMARSLSAGSIQSYSLSKRSARELTALLGHLPSSVGIVYLIDDLILHSTAPEYLARFAGFRGQLIVVNSIEPVSGCKAMPPSSSRYRLTRSPAGTELDYSAPACFYQINEAPLPLFHDKEVTRGQWMTYRFPDMTTRDNSSGVENYDPGGRWSAVVTDPSCAVADACVWLGLDLESQAYYVLSASTDPDRS
jgi:hypothetical protein